VPNSAESCCWYGCGCARRVVCDGNASGDVCILWRETFQVARLLAIPAVSVSVGIALCWGIGIALYWGT